MTQTKSRPEVSRAETRAVLDGAARAMRRTVRGVAQFVPIPEQIDRATRILDSSGIFLSRGEIEQMAAEVAADYCNIPSEECPQCHGTFARGTGWGLFCSPLCADEEMADALAAARGLP